MQMETDIMTIHSVDRREHVNRKKGLDPALNPGGQHSELVL